MTTLRIGMVGSRGFDDYEVVLATLRSYIRNYPNTDIEVVSGGARGADTLSDKASQELGVPTKIYLPDWDRYGRGAGFVRNTYIAEDSDILLAFCSHWEPTRGTADTIRKAREMGKTVHIYQSGLKRWTC